MDKRKRLQNIRRGLKQYKITVKMVAERAGVSRVWASKILHAHDTSEKVLQAAEGLIELHAADFRS